MLFVFNPLGNGFYGFMVFLRDLTKMFWSVFFEKITHLEGPIYGSCFRLLLGKNVSLNVSMGSFVGFFKDVSLLLDFEIE